MQVGGASNENDVKRKMNSEGVERRTNYKMKLTESERKNAASKHP